MSSIAKVIIHASQFPEAVRRDLSESLRRRQVNHKFHYDSVKQTQKWLALHRAYSPSRLDPGCGNSYAAAFAAVAAQHPGSRVLVLGLGCGGGQKDARLLRQLAAHGRRVNYVPCDVSAAMVLVARAAVLAALPEQEVFPLVCDLVTTEDLPVVLDQLQPAPMPRVLTFFGMIPNFEPAQILPKLAGLMRQEDTLLFSANLAPGEGYAAGVERILPQYDNALTRDWLMAFLSDLGVERADGQMRFRIREHPPGMGLLRVEANFHFTNSRLVELDEERFEFRAGEGIGLFFSYRYTPELVRQWLNRYGLEVRDQWIASSGEEGVFRCRRS
jgi:L-histidine N-alpha-methyltransferase